MSDVALTVAGAVTINLVSSTNTVSLSQTESTIALSTMQWDAQLDDIAGLAVTNSNFIVGDGSNWVAESGNTARTSLGLGTSDSPTFAGAEIGDGTNYAEIKADGEINLSGTARVYKSTTINFNHTIVRANGKPTGVTLGAHSGFSLPVYAADDEELFACKSLPFEMDATVDLIAYVGCYLNTANNTKKFKLQTSWTIDNLAGNDVLSSSVTDVEVETTTGNVAQYTSYKIAFNLASVAASAAGGNKVSVRVRRLAASANEIAGEVVICGMALKYVSDRLGTAT